MLKIRYYSHGNKYGVKQIDNEVVKEFIYETLEEARDAGVNALEEYFNFEFDDETKEKFLKLAEVEYLMSKEGRDKYIDEFDKIQLDLSKDHIKSGFARIKEDYEREERTKDIGANLSPSEIMEKISHFLKNSKIF